MPILRAQGHKITPWKNGGGETREIAVSPEGAGLDGFDWRVSMARVARDGAFSIFPGIDRILCVLSGEGIELRVGDRPAAALTQAADPLAFPGDEPTFGRLLAGPIWDLNVMVRRGASVATVERRPIGAPLSLERTTSQRLVFCARGAARIVAPGETGTLEPHDAWRAGTREGVDIIPAPFALIYVIEIETR